MTADQVARAAHRLIVSADAAVRQDWVRVAPLPGLDPADYVVISKRVLDGLREALEAWSSE